jgi:DNA-binding beta-propeller fold protein YncE
MRGGDDQLREALKETAPSVPIDGLRERLARRRRSYRVRHQVASGVLAVLVVMGSAGGFLVLRHAFGSRTKPATTTETPSPPPEPTFVPSLRGTAHITATIPLPAGSYNGGIAVGAGSAWVGLSPERGDGGSVLRIDLATNDVVANIPVHEGPARKCITATDDAVWVASTGLLQRIDPATNSVVAEVDLADRFVSAITAVGSEVWAITIGPSGGVLVHVDQRTNEIVAQIPLGYQFTGYEDQVLASGGSIWVLGVNWNQERDTEYGSDLVRVDPETNTISERIAVGGFRMAVGPGSVWVRFPLDGAFDGGDEQWRWTTVDYATNEPSAPFEFDAGLQLVTENELWTVGDAAHDYVRVSRYDVQTLELASRSEPIEGLYHDSVIDPVSKTVWISALDGIVRMDISLRSEGRASPAGGSPEAISESCDPDLGHVWRTKMAPWLASILVTVGSPDGQPLAVEDLNDTGSALQVGDARGEVVLYVHASAPDLEHDPRPSMVKTGSVGDYELYTSVEGTVRHFGAFAPTTWVTLGAYADTPAIASRWERDTDISAWLDRVIAEIAKNPIPTC